MINEKHFLCKNQVLIVHKKEIAKTNVLAIDAISIVFLLLYDSHFLNHYIL